jgi:hypothetical protein
MITGKDLPTMIRVEPPDSWASTITRIPLRFEIVAASVTLP